MSDQRLTVSNGRGKIVRVPLSRLEEFRQQGFYVPLLRNRTIVSNGKKLAEIPLEELVRYKSDGFSDTLVNERPAIFQINEADDTDLPALDLEDNPLENANEATISGEGDTINQPAPDGNDSNSSIDSNYGDTLNITSPTAPAAATSHGGSKTRLKSRAKKNPVVSKQEPENNEQPGTAETHTPQTLQTKLADFHADAKRLWGVLTFNTLLHAVGVLCLAMYFLPVDTKKELVTMDSSMVTREENPETLDIEQLDIAQPVEEVENIPIADAAVDSMKDTLEPLDIDIDDKALTAEAEPTTDSTKGDIPAAKAVGEMGGRSEAGRSQLVAKMGGNAASETAVHIGLQWMERHQQRDGGWSFDHRGAGCNCGDYGDLGHDCRNAATGFALLTLLGAGNTPTQGRFSKSVERGIRFLLRNGRAVPAGVDLRGKHAGNTGMYTHAIATTAMCEVLAMLESEYAQDRFDRSKLPINIRREKIALELRPVCQAAINFIVNAQSKKNGSWGYNPGTDGDTSILGWQVMALKSAKHAHIPFPGRSVAAASRFLGSVQDKDGKYGYRDLASKKPSTTAIGIVCRMLAGASKSNALMKKGVSYLSVTGPDPKNMYYNYYATQVMLNWGGDTWKKWNEVMRDQLVNSQIKEGHAAGSWDLADQHGKRAGRLYMTALCTMTLEVYYRHLPLYGDSSPYESEPDSMAKAGEGKPKDSKDSPKKSDDKPEKKTE